MDAGIDCVAITDHNTASWIDKLKDEYAALQAERPADFRELHLFPGVEITVHGGAHLLAIFDPNTTREELVALLGRIGLFPNPAVPSSECTEQSFPQVVRAVAQAGGIPIPAHADSEHGVLIAYSGETLKQVLESEDIIAAEVGDPYQLQSGPAGHQRIQWTPVLGSDSHHPIGGNGQRFPGSHFTWVKMGRPSIEGLKLALFDGASLSILRSDEAPEDPNRHSDLVSAGVRVSDAQYAGRGIPLRIFFSPWMTTIIGGRGTGKSTVVEMMRLCLRRDREVPDELREELGRFAKIPQSRTDSGALSPDTEVVVQLKKGEESFRSIWRSYGNGPAIKKLSHGRWQTAPGDVRSRFPCSATQPESDSGAC